MAALDDPAFGPVSAVTITCSLMPVLTDMQISTSVSFSGTSTLGTSTLVSGSACTHVNNYYIPSSNLLFCGYEIIMMKPMV